jgi:hypothetical protein
MGKRESLNEYIKEVRLIPFSFMEHDCLTFTNTAFQKMYGKGWADDWLGRYTEESKRKELQKEFGYKSLLKGVDDRLTRINYVPPLGALIATKEAERWITGFSLGVSNGKCGIFLSAKGLIQLPFNVVNYSWIKET